MPEGQRKAIEVYFWPTPNGWKIPIMLEECGLPYVVKLVNLGAGEQFKPSFLKISPNNRIPAIVDPKGPGGTPISVFESGAILKYLAEKTGKFYPQAWRERVIVDEWLSWQIGNLGPMAGQAHHFRRYKKPTIKYAAQRYTTEARRLYGVMNKRLSRRKYLADDYSIADIASWCWVVQRSWHGQDLEEFPNVRRWYDRVGARPAVRRGFHVGEEIWNRRRSDAEEKQARRHLFKT